MDLSTSHAHLNIEFARIYCDDFRHLGSNSWANIWSTVEKCERIELSDCLEACFNALGNSTVDNHSLPFLTISREIGY